MEFLNISITDMQIFTETYRRKSLSEAAQALFISRQSVARSIQNIEDILDIKLFTRSSSGIDATAAGEEFYTRCTPIIQSTHDMLCYMAEYKRKSQMEISIGFLGYIKSTRTSLSIISQFTELYPDITIKRTELEGTDVQSVLQKGELDFAFVNLDLNASNENLKSICLEEEEYILVVHKGHPLASLQEVPATALSGAMILFLSRYGIAVEIFKKWMNGTGISDYMVVRSGEVDHVRTCITEDKSIALLPKSSANVFLHATPQVVCLHLSPPILRHSGLLFRKNMTLTKEQQKFLDFFCAEHIKATRNEQESRAETIC